MGLLDGFAPQGFADRGGMLGRLLSLRPDLAQHQEEDQAGQGPLSQVADPPSKDLSTASPIASAIGSALDDFYRQTMLQGARNIAGYASDAIHDPAYFAHAIGPSLAGLGPVASELPGAVKSTLGAFGLARSATRSGVDQPLEIAGSRARDTQTAAGPGLGSVSPAGSNGFGSIQNGMLPALGLAAAITGRKSNELLAGAPQPIAPIFPEPPVLPVAPQMPWLSPHARPVAPQTPAMSPPVSPAAPRLGPIPEPTPATPSTTTPPSSDDRQQALGPEWRQLQSFRDDARGGVPSGKSDAECREEYNAAVRRCADRYDEDMRNVTGPYEKDDGTPWNLWDCIRGQLSPDCGGNETDWSIDPSRRRKRGRGSRRKR